MKFIFTCVAAAQLVSAAVDIASVKHSPTAQVVPNSYIVELSSGSHLKRGFVSPHEELYHDLRRRGAVWEVTREYSDDLLTGAAIKLSGKSDLVKLAGATSVRSITPNYIRHAPKPVYQGVARKTTHSTNANDGYSPHIMTGVDKLHSEGYFGKGIKIGIIDDGIDYTHPALGGKFGPGNKVIGGYDFVGDDFTGQDDLPPAPDDDPMDKCGGHGTHVAGIIGANPNNPWNISGVAYEAELNAYRVFSCKAGTSDDIIIAALQRAFNDGNNVINLSLGGPQGWTEGATGVVASRIAEKGRIVLISAGNDGQQGSWYAGNPSSGINVISIGSVDNTVLNTQSAIVSNGREIPYLSANVKNLDIPSGLPIYSISEDTSAAADACNPLPNSTPDLSGFLVLIRGGTCPLINQTANAAAHGAKYFLIYNSLNEKLIDLSSLFNNGTVISKADGEFLLKEAIPNNYTISFPDAPTTIANPTGGLMASSSSYGPTFDMYLKPAVSAPGGFILSTVPVALGSWGVKSGTSMAAPFAAGSAALFLQIRGNNVETAKAARAIFQNTAIPVKETTANNSLIETASHQGAGLINVYDAVKNTGSLLPAELLLNDTAHFNGAHTLQLYNGGKSPVTYALTHVPAGTADTIEGSKVISGPVPLTRKSAIVKVEPSTITVPAGEVMQVKVSIQPPKGLDASRFPVYSGYIKAIGSDETTLQSTYMGLAATLKDAHVIDDTDAYFGVKLPCLIDAEGNPTPLNDTTTYTMNGTEFPIVNYRLNMGTPLLRMDLINSKPKANHSVEDWLHASETKTVGALYQGEYLPRNSMATTAQENGYTAFAVSAFSNGTEIPSGTYKILFSALKITGNPEAEKDYEVWTSPTIVVKRA